MQKLVAQAKQILKKVPFMHIASVSDAGMPWNSPVWVAYDNKYVFFWNSSRYAQHSKNIGQNKKVFAVISDYEIKRAIYMEGKAYELTEEKEIQKVLRIFFRRKGRPARPISDVSNESPRRMYKFIPEKFYTNTNDKVNELPNDQRVEIKLK